MSDLIEAFGEYLLINKGVSKNTLSAYINDLEQLNTSSKKELLAYESEDIILFLSQFSNPRTRNRKLASINAFFHFLNDLDFSAKTIKLPSAKTPSTLPLYLEYETIMQSVENIEPTNWIAMRDRAIILFLYASGIRVSEAVNAKREDLSDGWLRVRYGKGEKERVVPVANIALIAITLYLNERNDDNPSLFINYKKSTLSRISIFKITKKYLAVSPHVLRHSYASGLILGGADLRIVQELLGHSSLITTQIYTHIQKPHLKETLNTYHPLAKEDKNI
ncbi:MAG TPA: integrase [Nitratifractor sp.]|nr:integrase [Nitratifractor sp.]